MRFPCPVIVEFSHYLVVVWTRCWYVFSVKTQFSYSSGVVWRGPELARASVSKRVLMQNLSYENEHDLHEISTCSETHQLWMVSHQDSFWHRGKRQLRNGWLGKRTALVSEYKIQNNLPVNRSLKLKEVAPRYEPMGSVLFGRGLLIRRGEELLLP